VDWKVFGQGMNVKMFICPGCSQVLKELGLIYKNPLVGLAALVAHGRAIKPPVHAYLQHSEWKKVWMHMLDGSGLPVRDEFAALEAIRQVEPSFFSKVATEYGPVGVEPVLDSQPRRTAVPLPGGVIELLKRVQIGMPKREVGEQFKGYDSLPPPADGDGLGFKVHVHNAEAIALSRFQRGKLMRFTLMMHPSKPSGDELSERFYSLVKNEVISAYGEPHRCFDPSGSDEFWGSEMLVWVAGELVVTLTLSLLRHGAPPTAAAVALIYGDREHDSWSKAQAQLVRS
jgi:hypothetical protein